MLSVFPLWNLNSAKQLNVHKECLFSLDTRKYNPCSGLRV